ncbi:MAG: glycosyltransferase, partial [Humidesulfovibrio sp.]|nr:glycosyltransferase [Humidesulfovibrio sp.]
MTEIPEFSAKASPKVSPKVSIGLPCRNAARSLPAALDSLLAQTLSDFEIVAVDDGSTDQTWNVLS